MRVQISKTNNVVQAQHSKIAFYVPTGEYTLSVSVDGNNWKTIDASIIGPDTVHVNDFPTYEFFKLQKSDAAEWEGVALV